MANYSTDRPHKKADGSCPYCGGHGEFVDVSERGKFKVQQHSCGKYSQLNQANNNRYPLQNPEDPGSSAYL